MSQLGRYPIISDKGQPNVSGISSCKLRDNLRSRGLRWMGTRGVENIATCDRKEEPARKCMCNGYCQS